MDSHHTPTSQFVPAAHPFTALLKILNGGELPSSFVRPLPHNKRLLSGICEKQARAFGFSAKMYSLRFASIPAEATPVILETESGDGFLILKEKIDEKSARVILSDGRESVISLDLLSNVYSGRCLFLNDSTGLGERLHRVWSTIQQGWVRHRKELSAAMALNLIFAAIVIYTGRNSDTLLRELDKGGALMPVYATILSGIMALAYSMIRPGLIQSAKKPAHRIFRPGNAILGRNEFAACIDFPTALTFATTAVFIGKFAAIPMIAIGAVTLFTFIVSRKIELRNSNEDTQASARNASITRSVFAITAILAGILSANQQITTGEMIATTIFGVVAMQLLFTSRSLLLRAKLVRYLRVPETSRSVFVLGGHTELAKGFEFKEVQTEGGKEDATINFKMKTGERIALFGMEGSGKTALFRLMLGFTEPQSGEIRLAEKRLDQLCSKDIAGFVGHLGQDAPILQGTLRTNLELGNERPTDRQMLEALNVAGLSHLLVEDEYRRGLDLPVGTRGLGLTVLERQCLCLARTLVGRPQILLLDDPVARLDPDQAERFYELVALYLEENPKRSVIVATPKIVLPELTERVLVMENGTLVGDGPVSEVGKSILVEEDLPTAFSHLMAS